MKRVLVLFFLQIHFFFSPAQSFQVMGKVVDQQTKTVLNGASVFCQNTTMGTLTNASGEFSMWLKNGGYDLVISFTGYETQSIHINQGTENIQQLMFELKPKEKSLEAVSVTVTNEVKDGLAKYGDFFRENFIGLSDNSRLCTIDNPQVLHFFFSKKKNRLKITSHEDLLITNRALGYQIRYQLDSFVHEYGTGITQYTGFPFFEELPDSLPESANWKANRERAYYGSLLHFMRCYYDSTLGDNGYKIELVSPVNNKTSLLKNPYDSTYYNVVREKEVTLDFPGKIRVVYLQEAPEKKYLEKSKLALNTSVEVSLLDFTDEIIIEENGYFYDQRDILNYGYWNWEKIADFLPYNFEPEDTE